MKIIDVLQKADPGRAVGIYARRAGCWTQRVTIGETGFFNVPTIVEKFVEVVHEAANGFYADYEEINAERGTGVYRLVSMHEDHVMLLAKIEDVAGNGAGLSEIKRAVRGVLHAELDAEFNGTTY